MQPPSIDDEAFFGEVVSPYVVGGDQGVPSQVPDLPTIPDGIPLDLPGPTTPPTTPEPSPTLPAVIDDDDDDDPEYALALGFADPVPAAWDFPKFQIPETADPLAFEEAWSRLSTATKEAYQRELLRMAMFLQWPHQDAKAVLMALASLGRVPASNAIRAYRDFGEVAPATRARRVAAVSKLLKELHHAGIIDWTPTASAPPVHAIQSRQGPPPAHVEKMLSALAEQKDRTATRDLALLTVMYDSALRAGGVASIRICDVDLERRTVKVTEKGDEHRDRSTRSLSTRSCEAIAKWLIARGPAPATAPLFFGEDPNDHISTRRIGGICHERGKLGGIAHLRPHGLRHTAATVAAQSGAPAHQLAKYLGHADPKTSMRYIDDLSLQSRALTDLVSSAGKVPLRKEPTGVVRPVAKPDPGDDLGDIPF